jgi:hypothetical protein
MVALALLIAWLIAGRRFAMILDRMVTVPTASILLKALEEVA